MIYLLVSLDYDTHDDVTWCSMTNLSAPRCWADSTCPAVGSPSFQVVLETGRSFGGFLLFESQKQMVYRTTIWMVYCGNMRVSNGDTYQWYDGHPPKKCAYFGEGFFEWDHLVDRFGSQFHALLPSTTATFTWQLRSVLNPLLMKF